MGHHTLRWVGSFLILGSLLAPLLSFGEGAPPPSCTASREFITALEFLRQEKAFSVPEPDARKLATQVSAGCSGAAGRFIRVSKLLVSAGMGGPDAVKLGLAFTRKSDSETQAFATVFQRAFLEDGLDLDISASVRMAKSLSLDFEGDIPTARQDFETLVAYCLSPKQLDLPRPRCATFAVELARKGQIHNKGIARPFINAYEFLKSENGPGLTTEAAVRLATDLVTHGPAAPDNFTLGYNYAISKKGLDLPRNEAIGFARTMADQAPLPGISKPGSTNGPSRPAELKPNRKLGSVH